VLIVGVGMRVSVGIAGGIGVSLGGISVKVGVRVAVEGGGDELGVAVTVAVGVGVAVGGGVSLGGTSVKVGMEVDVEDSGDKLGVAVTVDVGIAVDIGVSLGRTSVKVEMEVGVVSGEGVGVLVGVERVTLKLPVISPHPPNKLAA